MKRILAPILLLTLLFPALAQGQSLNDWVGKGKGILCETTGVGCPESVDSKDLVGRDGVYFKKRTDVPFTGKTTGDEQGVIEDGKRIGLWVGFHENGQLRYKGTYKNGKMDGPWVRYFDNGQFDSKETYKDGKKDGPLVSYDGNGKLYYKATYKDGKKNGPYVTYWDDGQLLNKGNYKNDKKEGPWSNYKSNGQLLEITTFKNGVRVSD